MKVALLILVGVLLLILLVYTVSALIVNPNRQYTKNSRYYRFLLNLATGITLKIVRLRVHKSGWEKLPQNGRFLLVCNHRSNFDPIINWYIMKEYDIAFISKKDNFKVPWFGRFIRRCCFLEIDRENPRKAMKTIIKAAELLKNNEVSVGVYPEGTRSKSGKLLEFHNGVFKIAQKSGVPVVVAAIRGAEDIHRNFPLHGTDVYFDIIATLPAEEVTDCRTDELADRAYALIKEKLSEPIGEDIR